MQGQTAKTPANVTRARALRAQGLLYREIGESLGVATSTVHAWLQDPGGDQRRARRDRYRGRCAGCGAPTDGSRGPRGAPRHCATCAAPTAVRRWTEPLIIERLQQWACAHGGQPPTGRDWAQRSARKDGRWPHPATVRRAFGSWNAAVTAAGLPARPAHGPAPVAAWPKDAIVDAMRRWGPAARKAALGR